MDLRELTPKTDEIKVDLVHPGTGEPLLNDDDTQMYITVWAPHSKQAKAAMYAQANERMKRKEEKFSAEKLEESALTYLAAITKDWSITYDGSQPKVSESKAKEIYDSLFWVKDQVEAGVNSFEVFTKA